MKIAFLVYGFPNLSETFILNQITGLLDAGHEVDIHASRVARTAKVHDDVRRYRLLDRTYCQDIPAPYGPRLMEAVRRVARTGRRLQPRVLAGAINAYKHGRLASSLGLLYASMRFLEHGPYDIVHGQFGTLGRTAIALRDVGAARQARIVVSFRGSDLTTEGRRRRYGAVFQKCDLLLPVCHSFREQLLAQGCDATRIRVHYSGIKVSRFPCAERRRQPGEPTRVLAVGRLVEKKGMAYAIAALARVKAMGRSVRLVIAGDGPLRNDLERMVTDLGLGAEVHLAGPKTRDEVLTLLGEAHLLVAPSVTAASGETEGIPNVLKEAMATGIPVIGTWHSGIPELVTDGVSGLLVPERDVDALAEALVTLVDHPGRWPAMGLAGRQRVEAEFDSDKLNKDLVELYEQLLLEASRRLPERARR
jgi:colanic acid/amylovoran biosynthesis glycosyltransferase